MEVPQKTKNRNIKWSSNPNPGHTSTREREVAQSCPTLCDPMDCSLPSSSVHGIFQAIVLEWIAISFSKGSFQPRDRTRVSHIVDRRFIVWATREIHNLKKKYMHPYIHSTTIHSCQDMEKICMSTDKWMDKENSFINMQWNSTQP